MSEEQPTLHIDTDWKKQAQEEKRKLAEQQKAKAEAAAAAAPVASEPMPRAAPAARPGSAGEAPSAGFPSLVQSITTQVLFHLGDLTPRGAEPQLNMDMAKYQIDLLGVLEEKTKNNLTPEEQHLLDAALYEVRMRFVGIASQIVNG